MNSEDLDVVKKQWMAEQLKLRGRAIFEDRDLSFQITPAQDSISLDTQGASDYDEPIVRNEAPNAFTLSGLKYIGGLDISFITQEEGDGEESATFAGHNASATGSNPNASMVHESKPDAYGVVTVLDYPALTLIHSITLPIRLTAPYIPSFLSYRETPAYLELLSGLRKHLERLGKEDQFPQVVLVDGNGQLHVREAGVATAVGVQADIPTIGVAKTYHPPNAHALPDTDSEVQTHWRLSQKGMKTKAREILKRPGDYLGIFSAEGDRYVGAALRSPTSSNFLFVSPGHRVSLTTAMRLAMALSKYRIPEPIRLADKMGREAAAKYIE
ncbi:RNA polymerase rpb8 domain-containing protein [Ceratobasidium sp. AG-Ba]|nr:RNA polymerase rpb8 domain-containing protein [Ceratobasidium sp. AG-Ba]